MSKHSVIDFNNVTVTYDRQTVLEKVNFTLGNGEFAYLIGQTGAGKSSFLRLIYRDLVPDTGHVQVADYNVTTMSKKEVPYLRRRLGIVFQDFQLLPDRTVYENVAFSMQVTGAKNSYIKQRVLEVLGMVGLSHKRKNMPNDLSGGEKQRVVIARSLANEPRILLADEPTGNLDPEASASIMELLERINNRGMAVLMVTHDYDTVKQYPYRTLKLKNGRISEVNAKEL
ncbi:cell division ATP-binding protein FtsE [Aliifodinibius salicampi]|uniref:Cell division ATP-binding protein FtsE n=1 Tax=Fodinibius salicampi TaxID=1920655 RepID=A0ABT3PVE0_9BACT|nr:cell division ATP-binding protein FtsE [Fodinibius salicampi]MCW9711812.1 cell division ATP-binding protein FtsE [Fodinibius salicampi]